MAISKNIIGYRPTWAEVNLDNVEYNFRQIKKIVSAGVKVMVIVKADAYGHGLVRVAKRLCACGVDYLGVASIDEGIALRKANIDLPVLVLGLVLKEDIEPLFTYDLTATVCTEEMAFVLNNAGKRLGKVLNAHIKVDTGMGRIGVAQKDAFKVIKRLKGFKFLCLEGIFTHLACADTDPEFTLHQIEIFNKLVMRVRAQGIHFSLIHAANSAGLINHKQCHFNMVRPGLITYGLYPAKGLKISLKPALCLKTKVIFVKKVPKGCGISYGSIYVTKASAKIATLPIGYGDGYPRNLSNLAPVLIKGKRFKISGRVCMDQIMVDVGDLPVKAGDEVVLIGSQGGNKITAEELAGLAGTIPYEIVCGLGSRIPRVYI